MERPTAQRWLQVALPHVTLNLSALLATSGEAGFNDRLRGEGFGADSSVRLLRATVRHGAREVWVGELDSAMWSIVTSVSMTTDADGWLEIRTGTFGLPGEPEGAERIQPR